MNIKKLILITIFFCSCNMVGAGTHGSLKRYHYSISKGELEKAVINVIQKNSNIYRDTTDKDYYNDGVTYLTIKIKNKEIENEYTFRYYGDQKDWGNSKNSEIFICYAYNKYGKGGDQENEKMTKELKKELINVFEVFFISKLDKELSIKHSDDPES